ncbi:MAG: serine/threonine protein kinase [Microcoleus sp. SM1_3_4]|nr:serine/threonine protein kinase [Microcoleus sp. SM1_3_4]
MEISILNDRYEINQQLSRKAGRQTLLALDRETGEQVVIKLLTFSSEFEWESLKLFERETQTLKTLSHPTIPKYLNSFELNEEDTKGFALVQTYIAAPSLESHIKSGRTFSEVEIKQIAESLLETLIYLHTQHPPVIHRDIKPSNVLLVNRSGNYVGQTYLVDFGAVQTAAFKNSDSFTVVGTYGYMPPEQFSGRTTPVSDLYSLGATLIYLVTGQHPANLMTDDLQLEFGQSTTLSPELTRWLQRLVQPTPSQRFANASEALEALKNPQVQELELPAVQPFGSPITIQQRNDGVCIRLPRTYLVLPGSFLENSLLPLVGLGLLVMIFTVSPWHIVSFIVFAYLQSSECNIFSYNILIDDEKFSFMMLLLGFKLRTWSYRKKIFID